MNSPEVPSSEIYIRALWMVDPALVDRATKDLIDSKTEQRDWAATLTMRIGSCDFPDERTAATAVSRFLAKGPTLRDNIGCLSKILFDWHQGLPNLRSSPIVRHLSRLVDADSLLCLCAPDCPADDPFDWGAVPFRNQGKAARVLQHESLDTHVHLGGILAPLFYWVAIMGGEFPLEALAALPNLSRRHATAEAWISAVERAMFLRMSLARSVQEFTNERGARAFPQLPVDADDWGIFYLPESLRVSSDNRPRLSPVRLKTERIRDAVLGFNAGLRLNYRLPKRGPDAIGLPD
ncbi:MAG: hypothetical protein ACRER2_10910 [Methylococcales bacterium]